MILFLLFSINGIKCIAVKNIVFFSAFHVFTVFMGIYEKYDYFNDI